MAENKPSLESTLPQRDLSNRKHLLSRWRDNVIAGIRKRVPHKQAVPVTEEAKNRQKTLDRREFFKRAGVAVVAGIGIVEQLKRPPYSYINKSEKQTQSGDKETTNTPEIHIKRINQIIDTDPGPERDKLELQYASEASGLTQIDTGLLFIMNKDARIKLRSERAAMRALGTEGLEQLTPEEVIWCRLHDIDQEALGVAKDMKKVALQLTKELESKGIHLDPSASSSKEILPKPEETLMLPAEAAAAVEFSGSEFLVIGDRLSGKIINEPVEKAALKGVTELWSHHTGINFSEDRIPMQRDKRYGIGITPLEMKKLNDDLIKIGKPLNPMFINMGVLATYLIMAKYGYDSRKPSDRQIAFNKWTDRQDHRIQTVGDSYIKEVINSKKN